MREMIADRERGDADIRSAEAERQRPPAAVSGRVAAPTRKLEAEKKRSESADERDYSLMVEVGGNQRGEQRRRQRTERRVVATFEGRSIGPAMARPRRQIEPAGEKSLREMAILTIVRRDEIQPADDGEQECGVNKRQNALR